MKKLLMILPLALILCFVVGCRDREAMAELEAMKIQAEVEAQNKELVKHAVEELNKENYKVFMDLFPPDYGFYSPSNNPMPVSREEVEEFIKIIFSAFPDINWSIEELTAEGDKVIVRFINRGTHEGEFQGIPATGNKFEIGSTIMFRIKDGKIVEERKDADMLDLMMQLGMELKPKEEEK